MLKGEVYCNLVDKKLVIYLLMIIGLFISIKEINADIIIFDESITREVKTIDFGNSEVNGQLSYCGDNQCTQSLEDHNSCPIDCPLLSIISTPSGPSGGGGAGSPLPNYSYPYINPYANPQNKTNIITQTVNVVKKVPWYTIPIFIVVLFLVYRVNLKRGMRKAKREEEKKKDQ